METFDGTNELLTAMDSECGMLDSSARCSTGVWRVCEEWRGRQDELCTYYHQLYIDLNRLIKFIVHNVCHLHGILVHVRSVSAKLSKMFARLATWHVLPLSSIMVQLIGLALPEARSAHNRRRPYFVTITSKISMPAMEMLFT